MTGAEEDRRRLGEWLVPLQHAALAELTPDPGAWQRLLEGRGNEAWAAEVSARLGEDDAAREARRARIVALAERRLTAFDAPWALELVQDKLDAAAAAAQALGAAPPGRPPLLATTMGGAVNGWAVDPGAARHTLILIPVGLCMFCNLAAKAIARVAPRIDHAPGRFGFDLDPGVLRKALEADRAPALRFAELVRVYLVQGRPDAARLSLPSAAHAPLHNTLLRAMEMFLVAHEYGHISAGHLDRPADPPPDLHRFEHEADICGLAATARALHEEDTDPVNALVGAHLFLRCAGIVARCLALLRGEDAATAGGDTPTHPSAATRIGLLAGLAGDIIGQERAEAARDCCGRYDIILDDFAATAEAQTGMLREMGLQPHGIWRPGGRAPQQGAWPALAL